MRLSAHAIVLWLTGAALIALLPLLWLVRNIFQTARWFGVVSVWTGAPIITIPKKCRAERLLGFRSLSIVRNTYFITDEFDYVLDRFSGRGIAFMLSYLGFVLMCLFARQVHAFADGGILPETKRRQFNSVELLAYRVLGMRLFIWTYGADVRIRETTALLGDPNCCSECSSVGSACVCTVVLAQQNYRRLERVATAIFSMGDMIEYTPGSRNDLFFWPVDLEADQGLRYQVRYPDSDSRRPLRVVHAPNHRQFKGTHYLEEAVLALRSEGVDIELVLVEGIPNVEAIDLYRSADVIFDQCLIGFHGYFALEAMALGKPVMCYIRKPESYLLHPEECPIINTHIDTIKEDLRSLVENSQQLNAIGRRGRLYVEKYFSMEAFARRLEHAYLDLGIMK